MKEVSGDSENITLADESKDVGRRQFLGTLGATAAGAVALGAIAPSTSVVAQKTAEQAVDEVAKTVAENSVGGNFFYQQRALAAYQLRVEAARENLLPLPPLNFNRPNNGDEERYPSRIGNYSKALPHKPNGEVVPSAYNAFLDALRAGTPAAFEQMPLGGTVKQTNPQSGLAFDMEGQDFFTYVQPPPPAFRTRELAAEIAENYWMALLRDVPFTQYSGNPIAAAAANDLNLFGADFKGPKNGGGQVTPDLLFRGLTTGDKTGPYMSQFWYLPCFFGPNQITQKIQSALPVGGGGSDYMTDFASWLAVQNGVPPSSTVNRDPVLRYLRSGRDIGEWVHVDMLFQAYYQAFLVVFGLGVPFDSGNPYRNSATQDGFGTFGPPHIATVLCEVATRALRAVWNQKWIVHRRMRPEVFGERIDRTLYHSAGYPVHPEILNSLSTGSRLGGYMPTAGNAFLPMAFPEGSPTHPSYGAGHATVAGACVTILKAWFDESYVIPNPVVPDPTGQVLVPYVGPPLTIGGELNKTASNVAIGRNIAGVHWRSDATESLKLGEAVAISILKDQKSCYNETFSGFSLKKFDGTTVVV